MSYLIRDRRLAEEIDAVFKLSPAVKNAIASTDRSLFIAKGLKKYAYKIDALPIGKNQFISSPLTVAKMTEFLKPVGADSVLEIGCGSGYQAAVLSRLIRRVFSIERISSLLEEARISIKEAKITNINTRLDDGQKGWREFAPYDRILFSASLSSVPSALFDQLSDGGILLAPIKKNQKQFIIRYTKRGFDLREEILEECSFVPVLDGIE